MKRDTEQAMIAGVCAGLARHLNIDPLFVRLAFALLGLGGFGISIIAYIILWILMPAN